MIKIMRGIPGSGKSYHAKRLIDEDTEHWGCTAVISADQYFTGPDDVYRFDPSKIAEAHKDCFRRFYKLASRLPDVDAVDFSPSDPYSNGADDLIVVDNTGTHLWEVSPYILAGESLGHTVELVHVTCDVETAIARNQHGVPAAVIRRMAEEFEAALPFWSQTVIEN